MKTPWDFLNQLVKSRKETWTNWQWLCALIWRSSRSGWVDFFLSAWFLRWIMTNPVLFEAKEVIQLQKVELERHSDFAVSGLKYWKQSQKNLNDLGNFLEVSWDESNAFLLNSSLGKQFDKLTFTIQAQVTRQFEQELGELWSGLGAEPKTQHKKHREIKRGHKSAFRKPSRLLGVWRTIELFSDPDQDWNARDFSFYWKRRNTQRDDPPSPSSVKQKSNSSHPPNCALLVSLESVESHSTLTLVAKMEWKSSSKYS